MNCARCIHYTVCPHDAIMHDESRWETKKCVHFVDESEVKEIVRGEWVEDGYQEDYNVWQCSTCKEEFILEAGTPTDNKWNFCPHCGADMRGEKND